MSDPTDAAGDPGANFRLIYRSHSLITAEERRTVLGEIFTTARRKNKRLGVTGALVVSGDAFVQALEGEESVVRDLYATISQDARHDHVTLVEEVAVDGRTFGRWAMAKVAEDGGADIRLMSNAKKGVIVAGPRADMGVTPEQEAVLSVMREAAVFDALGT
jgi:Sensors of blue-light using FAD